jgi:hypothetical protein
MNQSNKHNRMSRRVVYISTNKNQGIFVGDKQHKVIIIQAADSLPIVIPSD